MVPYEIDPKVNSPLCSISALTLGMISLVFIPVGRCIKRGGCIFPEIFENRNEVKSVFNEPHKFLIPEDEDDPDEKNKLRRPYTTTPVP